MFRRKMNIEVLLILISLMVGSIHLMAQKQDTTVSSFWKNWRIDLHSGAMFYYGDLVVIKGASYPIPYPRDWRLGYGLSLTKQITPAWGVRGRVINGEYAGRRDVGIEYYSFSSNLFQTSLETTYDFTSFFRNKKEEYTTRLYGIAGIGLMNYKADLYEYPSEIFIRSVGDGEGSGINGRMLEGDFSLGLGFDIHLSEKFLLSLETAYLGSNSDQLDAYEGTTGKKDVLQYTSVGLGYSFNFKNDKPSSASDNGKETSASWKQRQLQEGLSSEQQAQETTQKEEMISSKDVVTKEANKVDAICWVPDQVKGNESFIVSIEINKGEIKGRAEIKILLPMEYTALDQEIEEAVFVANSRNVAIYYNPLPDMDKVSLKFRVKSDRPQIGTQSIYIIGKITSNDGIVYNFSTVARFNQVSK